MIMADLRDKGKLDQETRKKLDDVSKIMKNITKSFEGVKQESLRGLFDANTMEKNGKVNVMGSLKQAAKSSYDNFRASKTSDTSTGDRIRNMLGLSKESEKMMKSYIQDVRQGKLYDPKKADADDMFETFGFDDVDFSYEEYDYGDSDSFFSYEDEKGNEVVEGKSYFGEQNDAKRHDAIAARGIAESKANTISTNTVIATASSVSATAIVRATEANTVAAKMEFGKLQAINAKGFDDISTLLNKHISLADAHYKRSEIFYNEQLRLSSELVKLGIKGQANTTHEAYKGRQVDEDDPYTLLANGDVKGALKKMAQQQWRSSIIATSLSMIPTMIQSIAMNGNFHSFIKEQASSFLRSRVGSMFKGSGGYEDIAKNTGNFFRHMSLSDDYVTANIGEKLRPGVKNAETFTTRYKNKTIGFDEQTHRTINIGMMRYLAEMTAVMTKSEVKVFDPESGKFRPEKSMFEEFQKNVKAQGIIDPRLGNSLAGRIHGLIKTTQAKHGTSVGIGMDGKIQLAKELDLIMPNLAKKGYGVTALLSMSYRRFTEFYRGLHEDDFYLLKDALHGMYQTDAGKRELDAIDDRMLDAIEKRNAFVKNVNSKGSGSAYAFAMDGFNGHDDKYFNQMMDNYGEDVKEVRATRIFHENTNGAKAEAVTRAKGRQTSAFDLTFGPMIRSNLATLINTINNAKNLSIGDKAILEDIPAPLKRLVAKFGKARAGNRGVIVTEDDRELDAIIENIKSERDGDTIMSWISRTSNSIGAKIANMASDIGDISNDEGGRKALGDTLIKGGIGGALGIVGGSILTKIPIVRGIADTFGFNSPIVMASLGVSEAIARSKDAILGDIDDPEKKQKMESFLKGFEKASSAIATGGMATSFMSNVLMKIPIVNGIFHGVTQVMGPFAPLFKAGLSAAIGFTLESERVKKKLFGEGAGEKTFIQNMKTKLFGDEKEDGVLTKYFSKTKDFFNDKKSKFNDWFSSNVKEPFREGFKPIRDIFLRRTDKMLDDTGESTKGIFSTMMEKIDKKLIEPASKMAGSVFSKLLWGVGKLVSMPFKIFGAVGKMFTKKGSSEESEAKTTEKTTSEMENATTDTIKEQEANAKSPEDITGEVDKDKYKANAEFTGAAGFNDSDANKFTVGGKKISEVGCAIGAMCSAFSAVTGYKVRLNPFMTKMASSHYVKGMGIHMAFLKTMGRRYGLGVRYFDTSQGTPHPKSIEKLLKEGHAFIALTTIAEGNHYVAVTRMVGDGMVTIDDPKNGKVEESTASFIAMSNKLILVSPARNLEDIKSNAVSIKEATEINENGGEVDSITGLPPRNSVVATPKVTPKVGMSIDRSKLDINTRTLVDLIEDNHDELMEFLKDHLSGTGYNANYIRKLLAVHLGPLDNEESKDYLSLAGMKGKFSSILSKLNIFRGLKKFKRKASDKIGGLRNRMADFYLGEMGEDGERDGLFKHWIGNPFMNVFGGLGRGLKKGVGAIGAGIGKGFGLLGKGAKGIGGGIADLISGAFGLGKKGVSALGKSVGAVFGFIPKTIKGIGNAIGAAGKSLTKVIGGLGDGIAKVGNRLLDGISGITKGIWKGVTTVTKGAWNGGSAVLKGAWGGIKAVGNGIKTVAKDTWQGAKNLGNALVGKMSKYTSDKITKVELVGGVVDNVKHVNAVAVVGAIDSASYASVNDEINARGKDMKPNDLQPFKAEAASESMEDANILNAFNGKDKVVTAGAVEHEEKKGFLETIGGLIKGLGIGLLGAALTSMVSKDAENFFKGMYDMIGADGEGNVEREQGQVVRAMVKKGVRLATDVVGGTSKFLAKSLKKLAESKFAKSVKSTFVKNIDKIMESGGGKAMIKSLEKAWAHIFNSKLVKKVLGTKVAAKIGELAVQMAAKAGSKASIDLAKKAGRGVLTFIPFIGQALDVAFFAYDLLTGMSNAPKLFKVSKDNVDAKMRTVAGVVNAIQGLAANKLVTMLFAFIPTEWLVDIVYKAIADDEEEKELEAKREDFLKNGGEQDGFMDIIKNLFRFGGDKEKGSKTSKETSASAVELATATAAGATATKGETTTNAKSVASVGSSSFGYGGAAYGAVGGMGVNSYPANIDYGQQNGNLADLKAGGNDATTGSGQIMNATGVNKETKGQGFWEKIGNTVGSVFGNDTAGSDIKVKAVSNTEAAKAAKKVLATSGLSKEAQAAILGNIQVESNFKLKPESLYYTSASRIRSIFPTKTKGLSDAQVNSMVKNEQKLGDHVYGDKGGFKYRGRGFIQLTGKSNYAHYAKRLGVDLVGNPDLALDPTVASRITLAYMQDRAYPLALKRYKKHINKLTLEEASDVVTRAVQGEDKNYNSGFLAKHMAEKKAAAKAQYKTLGDVKAAGFISQKNMAGNLGTSGTPFSQVGCGPSSTLMALEAAGFNVDPKMMYDMASGINMSSGMSMNDISSYLTAKGISHEVIKGNKISPKPSILLNRKGLGHHFTAAAGGKTYDPLQGGPRNGVSNADVKGSIAIDPVQNAKTGTTGGGNSDILAALGAQTAAIVNAINSLAKVLSGKDSAGGKGVDDVLDMSLLDTLNTLSFLRTGNI